MPGGGLLQRSILNVRVAPSDQGFDKGGAKQGFVEGGFDSYLVLEQHVGMSE